MIVIFVEFIDQLIDYPINRASPVARSLWDLVAARCEGFLVFCPVCCNIAVLGVSCLTASLGKRDLVPLLFVGL